MKKIFFVFLLSFTFSVESQDVIDKNINLQDAYNRVICDKSTESWTVFFNLFPDTFEKFDSVFGYHNGQEGPLYDEYPQYISFFFDARHYVESCTYYDKLINIAKDAKWDADAINLFQFGIVDFVINESSNSQEKRDFLEILSKFSDTDISDFWRFYYDDLYPDNHRDKYYKTISAIQGYERLLQIMEKRYLIICNK